MKAAVQWEFHLKEGEDLRDPEVAERKRMHYEQRSRMCPASFLPKRGCSSRAGSSHSCDRRCKSRCTCQSPRLASCKRKQKAQRRACMKATLEKLGLKMLEDPTVPQKESLDLDSLRDEDEQFIEEQGVNFSVRLISGVFKNKNVERRYRQYYKATSIDAVCIPLTLITFSSPSKCVFSSVSICLSSCSCLPSFLLGILAFVCLVLFCFRSPFFCFFPCVFRLFGFLFFFFP